MTLTLILVRWLHLSASILLGGLFLFQATIFLPAMKKNPETTGALLKRIHLLTCGFAFRTLFVGFVSWFLWSWLVASIMSGDDLIASLQSGDWVTILLGTQFGHTWLFRAIVSLLIGAILWVSARRSGGQNFISSILASLSIIELFSLVWAGHATASPGHLALVHLLADGFHLVALAFWPGSLAPLAAFLLMILKSSQAEAIALASPVVRRFSASSLIAVTFLALTGLLNSAFMVGSFPALLASAYGQILISKLILFVAMIGLGAWNLLVLKPRIRPDLPPARFEEKSALRLLVRNILWEIGLGTLVVLIVGLLGITPPPAR
jgi:putative copper resistance protein D